MTSTHWPRPLTLTLTQCEQRLLAIIILLATAARRNYARWRNDVTWSAFENQCAVDRLRGPRGQNCSVLPVFDVLISRGEMAMATFMHGPPGWSIQGMISS